MFGLFRNVLGAFFAIKQFFPNKFKYVLHIFPALLGHFCGVLSRFWGGRKIGRKSYFYIFSYIFLYFLLIPTEKRPSRAGPLDPGPRPGVRDPGASRGGTARGALPPGPVPSTVPLTVLWGYGENPPTPRRVGDNHRLSLHLQNRSILFFSQIEL